jgi:hypothetical protein
MGHRAGSCGVNGHVAIEAAAAGAVETERARDWRDGHREELPRRRGRGGGLSSRDALFVRGPRLVADLAVARVSGSWTSAPGRLSRIDLLVVDDFLLAPRKDAERRDLLEVLEIDTSARQR